MMGVLNVTPDSFSDGGDFLEPEAALEQALRMQESGAALLDVGAESTRPGSDAVTADGQLARLLPVLSRLTGSIRIPISIDTSSAIVAEAALAGGASIVNDITGFHADRELPKVCATHRAGVVLMHIQGTPLTMQEQPRYDNLIAEVSGYLRDGISKAERAGIEREFIVVDPGIGFGKSFDENYHLLANLKAFQGLGAGVLVGTSRKGFTGEFNRLPPNQRQYSTAATVAISILRGADVVRVHDVKEMKQVADICDRFRELKENHRDDD